MDGQIRLIEDEQRHRASTSDAGAGKFHTIQPLRDLESNWTVDLAKNLEDYLLKICSGEINGQEESHLSVNFAEAALLLQGSIQVYSRKVEYLYSLVLHALEFISQKSQQDQPESSSAQPEESGSCAVPPEADDSFWCLDDIPEEPKNSLDKANCKDTLLNYFVKPPANLVVLEGDCLDASGDSGELESYLLATNDLYRDFILLDLCDAVAVNDFLNSKDKASEGKNGVGRGSSLASKSRKSFFSPTKRSGETGQKLSGRKSQDPNFIRSPDPGFDFNYSNVGPELPPSSVPGNSTHDFEMDDGFSESREFNDDYDNEDDPWKPLNPHEKGNLKVKPFKKVKAFRRDWAIFSKQIPITKEFPLARLRGTISSELNEIWEKQCSASARNKEPQTPPLYEKLRQSLVFGGQENFGAYSHDKDDQENGYDSSGPNFDPPDFDMPDTSCMNEEPLHSEKHDDGAAHFDTNDAFGHDDPNSHANLEDLCRSHLDSLLLSIAETEKQTALAARVSTWKQRIEQNLEEQDSRPPFDIHKYGQRVLDKLLVEADVGHSMSFTDVVRGQEKHDVARSFSALLQLVNNGNVELEKGGATNEFTCYTGINPFHVRLLSHEKRRDIQIRSSKKRVKSPLKKGKENHPAATASPLSSQTNNMLSVKIGKVGGFRCTPEGKKRRKSRTIEPVDFNSAR